MARTNTKIGDVYAVRVNDEGIKYMQYIISDLAQLNSDVIRVFKTVYPINATPNLSEIVKGEVEFYAHCVTKLGVKLNHWVKVGNSADVGETDHILFRNTNDYGHLVDGKPIEISQNWHTWKINDRSFTRVGKLVGENRNAEIGIVMAPDDIVERIRTGKYDFFYPGFE